MFTNDASQCPPMMLANIHQGLTPVSFENTAQCPPTMPANVHQGHAPMSYENNAQCPPKTLARIHLALSPVITSLSCSSSLRSVARVLVGDDGTEISSINKGRKTNLQTSDDAGLGLLSAE